LLLATVREEPSALWLWLITMGYFITDTTTTLLLRIRYVKKFYGSHRFHAYQSLARRTGSHARVTGGVLLIELGWLLPLAIVAYLSPALAPWVFIVAVTPLILFCAIQGALHEL
jgi:Fuc2NAc and GlcNAc transferase